MKLRNKKTGEIHEITEVVPLHDMDKKFVIYSQTEGHNHAYKSLAELNEEWEDYKEPKEYWFVGDHQGVYKTYDNDNLISHQRKEIGNYFETEEEAEKAMEKLKALKRLKDKGIYYKEKVIDRKWYLEFKAEPQWRTMSEAEDVFKDIRFVFGDEE